jgi:hypothetical protein
MRVSDFFREEEDPGWDLKGVDPWKRMRMVLDTDAIDRLRSGPLESAADAEATYSLAQLAHEELVAYGTDGSQRLDDAEIAAVLRSLRVVLKRNRVDFNPPFRDFRGFQRYWSTNGMSGPGGWGARRGYLNDLFSPIFSAIEELNGDQAGAGVKGVDGQLKNLIFASAGPKPEIVLRDAVSNVIEVTRNAEHCLFYDRPLTTMGLTWRELVDWWRATAELDDKAGVDVARGLYARLMASMSSNPPEGLIFRTYCERYADEAAWDLPALLPQVYLHFDPLTRRQRGGRPSVLGRERIDFLLLLPRAVRVVLEVDGKQHYAIGEEAAPRLYAEMAAEDRRLRLRGYEVYRFGGFELSQPGADTILRSFFDDLFARYAA